MLAGWPLLGYAAAAAAWLAQHAILAYADRASVAALKRGERNRALGIVGFSTLGRLWLVALAILLVGLLGEREDGLAAAVLDPRPGHRPPRLPGVSKLLAGRTAR